jgi:hypothetical protein
MKNKRLNSEKFLLFFAGMPDNKHFDRLQNSFSRCGIYWSNLYIECVNLYIAKSGSDTVGSTLDHILIVNDEGTIAAEALMNYMLLGPRQSRRKGMSW